LSPLSPRDFFSRHAADYAVSTSHASGEDLRLLVQLLKLRGVESVLDVATGTGFTAINLAPAASDVHAVDMTAEMVSEARRLARERRALNVHFGLATADSLPYRPGSFDVVTCRRAAHHFGDVGAFLREASRVLRKGGRLGLADMSPVNGAEEFLNRIEVIRDRTHTRALTEREWLARFNEAGLRVSSSMTTSAFVEFEKWLSPVALGGSEEKEVREEFDRAPDELKSRLGMRFDGERVLGYVKTWIVIVGTTT
jgi:SAM-dependent methyltransferase